ncbi:MAG TPA: NAD(P)-dependent oxidoreductase [Candidatus Nanoarchaeia archaeon]|nr:NAD(P)-dependent oxidoreductase [Candidatus Nanoarchaeia archaeon]
MKQLKCAITGANGYVGSHLCNTLLKQNYIVCGMGRHNSKQLSRNIPYSLGQKLSPELFKGLDALIHCAYDFSLRKKEDIERINIKSSIELLTAAKSAGIKKIVYISSLTSFQGTRSRYGQAKLAVEQEAEKLGAVIVRPGLIFGRNAGGMIGSLSRLVSALRIVPVIGSGKQDFYLCHVDDLANLLLELISDGQTVPNPIYAVSGTTHTFKEILQALAAAKGRTIYFFPLPLFLTYFSLVFLEKLGWSGNLRSDSLNGLRYRNKNVDLTSSRQLNTSFRPFNRYTLQE